MSWMVIDEYQLLGRRFPVGLALFKSVRRGHLRDRKLSKKLSNSSNDIDIKSPVGVLGDSSEPVFVLSICLFDMSFSSNKFKLKTPIDLCWAVSLQ